MSILKITLACAVAGITLSAPLARADVVSADVAAKSLFNGVWAPEMRGPPGGPPRPDGPPPGGGRFGGPPPFGGPGGPPVTLSAEDAAKGLDQGDIRTRSQMTEEGRAKFAKFDPLETPTANCRTPGLPSIAMIPELQEWKVEGNAVTIRHESYDTRRIVHLDQTTHPGETHTVLGHAVGEISADTLRIETINLNEEWGGLGRNAPGSDARVVRETYWLIDKNTIRGEIEISDAKYLTHPLRMPVTLHRQPAGTQIVDFPCDVEVSQRDYKYMKQP